MLNLFAKALPLKPSIGEVLVANKDDYGNYGTYPAHTVQKVYYLSWKEFTPDHWDIEKDHDGFICIFGKFFKEEDVLFYKKEAFKEFKNSVYRKYKPTKTKEN